MDRHTFLDIPFEEHVVPFPNFAAVLMQHARKDPEKNALIFSGISFSYGDILNFCQKNIPQKGSFLFNIHDPQKELLPILALLYHGIPFSLDFISGKGAVLPEFESQNDINTDIPFVQHDQDALILNRKWRFSQYNLLAASQAVGRVFHLFRPGNACSLLPVNSMQDLLFALLAPLYFGKSIYFDKENPAAELLSGKAQYAWCKDMSPDFSTHEKPLLRDAAMLFTVPLPADAPLFAYYISDADDEAAGLALIRNARGEILTIPGCDVVRTKSGAYQINGHALGRTF